MRHTLRYSKTENSQEILLLSVMHKNQINVGMIIYKTLGELLPRYVVSIYTLDKNVKPGLLSKEDG